MQPEPNSGCWLWTASCFFNGYGQTSFGGRTGIRAHRVIYELLVGPIPTGLDLDHLCRVRCCVNPAHLEPVTRSVNLQRGDVGDQRIGDRQRAKTHCPAGHEYTPENTMHRADRPGRICRACGRARSACAYEKRKALQR